MFKLSKMHLAVFSALTLGASLQASAATSISGTVVTGAAASGATVCLDINRNKTCDSGEPQAVTAASGAFTLSVSAGDEAKYPIIAEIPATATQSAYALEAPLGRYQAINPYTTLVQNEIDNDSGLSLSEAENIVMRDFLVSRETLYLDYLAAGSSATDALSKATVIAGVFSRQMQEAGKVVSLATPAKRAAALIYARNVAGQRAIKMMEAIAAAGGDASKAADRMDLADPDRLATLEALEGQKLYGKVVTKPVKDVYPGSMLGALSYDAIANRIKFSVSSYKDGEILRIAPSVTTPQVMALDNVAKAPVTRVASYAALPDGSMRVLNNAKSETVWSTMEVDLGGQTFRLSQLISASSSPSSIPAAQDISVTFQPGDKMWREHHTKHPFGPDQVVFSNTAKDTNVASLEAWVKSKSDAFNPYDTFTGSITGGSGSAPGSYDVYFKPDSIGDILAGGDIIGHNISAKVESKVGRYYTKTVGATTYLIVAPTMLSRMNSAAERVYIHDAATQTVKYASYRDYVRHCLCWQRKLSISALNRIADALRKSDSLLVTPATVASTSTGHYVLPGFTQGFASLGSKPVAASFCGGCVLGNCGACPVAEVIGIR